MYRFNSDQKFLDFIKHYEYSYQNNIDRMDKLEYLYETNSCIKTVSFYVTNKNVVFNSEDGTIYLYDNFPFKQYYQSAGNYIMMAIRTNWQLTDSNTFFIQNTKQYNKVYFSYAGDGGKYKTSIGEKWVANCRYTIKIL